MTIISTVIAVPSFAALRLLGRWAPVNPQIATVVKDSSLPQPGVGTHRLSVRFIAFFVTAYRRSYLHAYLHRSNGACRFIPCCAEYTLMAVEKHGLLRGLRLAGGRVVRCTPAYHGDYLDFP